MSPIPGLAKEVQVRLGPSQPSTSPRNTRSLLVSTTFFQGATNLGSVEPQDLIMISQDSVYFYVSSKAILNKSTNRFHNMIPFTSLGGHNDVILMTESSEALTLLIHTIYGISCAHLPIPFENISSTVKSFSLYGLAPKTFILPDTWLYNMIVFQVSAVPQQNAIDAYCLAASLDLFDLAATVSTHLHSYVLSDLTDELALVMGPVYLKRLFFLHIERQETLKRILFPPPEPHPELGTCTLEDQTRMDGSWSLAATSLIWNPRADTPSQVLEETFGSVADEFDCQDCKNAIYERVREIVKRWSMEAPSPINQN